MTYIEFFDREAAENLCAALLDRPEHIVFLGDSRKRLEHHAALYRDIFARRGYAPRITCRTVNKNKVEDILAVLRALREEFPGCVFDATGGEDLCLMALGMLYSECGGENISIQRTNLASGTVQRYAGGENWVSRRESPTLTVEENVRMFGGRVIYDSEIPLGTHVWELDVDFAADIKAIWEVCRRDPKAWNRQVKVLETLERQRDGDSDALCSRARVERLLTVLNRPDLDSIVDADILTGLIRCGAVTDFGEADGTLRIAYKNDRVKRCLTKAGLALELRVFLALKEAEHGGVPVYNDVMTGVCIDWDGVLDSELRNNGPQNEIDVLAMRGMVPVFISCKNGMVETEELYKFSSVAESFGGKYARKVLIVNGLDTDTAFGRAFLGRAEELSVRVVTDFPSRSKEDILRLVKNF